MAGDQARVPLTFVRYGNESDSGAPGLPGYPIPVEARTQNNYIEGGVAGGGSSGDRHLLLIDRDRWLLYESYATRWNATASRWEADSAAVFDLNRNDRRTEGWTSADAAGLAIFPGLVRYDEVFGSAEITHAFRFTTRDSNGYVWPASHAAGSNASAPPMGTRLRLKASRNISTFTPEVQRIYRAMKTVRADRRRQRHRHVHQRDDGSAVEQRRAEPGVQRADRRRLRGRAARLAAGRGQPAFELANHPVR